VLNSSTEKGRTPFEESAESRGYLPEKAPRRKYRNVSHILKGKGKEGKPILLRFDVKKIKNKIKNDEWLWVEFKNATGGQGWIHGDAHFIAFERFRDFVIVNRKELVSWLGSANKIRYDLPFVSLAKLAKYRIYKRQGKKEETSQINVEDLKKLESFQLWPKGNA
jgi:hypothetical protein